MRIQTSARTRAFTVLGNEVLRDRRLSFTARGILVFLLSLPDGAREDVRTLADHHPGVGRRGVAKALDELITYGYYVRGSFVTRPAAGSVRRRTSSTGRMGAPIRFPSRREPVAGPAAAREGSLPGKRTRKKYPPTPTPALSVVRPPVPVLALALVLVRLPVLIPILVPVPILVRLRGRTRWRAGPRCWPGSPAWNPGSR